MSQVNVDRIKSRAGTGSPTFTNGLICSGVGTFSSQVSIAGTLTYEDVTNVDSVGIVTARLGLRVLSGGIQAVGLYTGFHASGISTFAGGDIHIDGTAAGVSSVTWDASANSLKFKDEVQATFGDGPDLRIKHNGTTGTIDNQTGDIHIKTTGSGDDILLDSSDDIFLRVDGTESGIEIVGGGAVNIYYHNSKKIATTNTGVTITGVTTTTQLAVGPGIIQENLFSEASAATGAGNYDIGTRGLTQYYTANTSGTFTINLRWDGSTALNTKLNVGSSIVFTVYYAQNNTSYYMTDFLIDGASQTEKWVGGTAPSAGGGSGVDCYTFNILKTANATFTVMANHVNFA